MNSGRHVEGDVASMYRGFSRRQFLKMGGAGLAGATLLGVAGCGGDESDSSASGDPWRQFEGTTINFLSENTPPTSAIAANLKPFKDKTGINVEISQIELSALVQQVALDLGSGKGQNHVIYADPYQVLAPYYQGLANLVDFNEDDSLPSVPRGMDDFIPVQLDVTGKFKDNEEIYGLPYDCPTMIWIYRKDLFEKYGDQMEQDLGFDPTPSGERTWEEYYEIARWLNDNAEEVPYGTGQQAKQHDSLMCDFSNVLWAYGGDYFEGGQEVGRLGTEDPGPSTLDQLKAIEAATFYQKLVDIAHPASTTWDWNGLGDAFGSGEVAMAPEWHEFAATFEGGDLKGKVGFAPLPQGPARNANMFGGSSIAINSGATEEEQGAAWLFLVWATSPEIQRESLFSEEGGGTPTRQSVYEMEAVQEAETRPSEALNMLTADAVSSAWNSENAGQRPKIPSWNECDTIIFTELSKMLAGEQSPEETMRAAKQGFDETTGAA